MPRRVDSPSETRVRAALEELSQRADDNGTPPSVLALASKFGMSNTTFRRHFPDIAALRSAPPTPGAQPNRPATTGSSPATPSSSDTTANSLSSMGLPITTGRVNWGTEAGAQSCSACGCWARKCAAASIASFLSFSTGTPQLSCQSSRL